MPDHNRNKLTVYLIKRAYHTYDSIIEDLPDIQSVLINRVGKFYYRQTDPEPPIWLEKFFLGRKVITAENITVQGLAAVLLVKLENGQHCALTFGSGRFLIKDNAPVERFGLITALNIIEAGGITVMDRRTMAGSGKASREQMPRPSDVSYFDMDFEKDLVVSITGKATDDRFGNVVSGRDALSLSPKADVRNIKEILQFYWETYNKEDYKTNFDWIDQLKQIKEPEKIEQLDEQLVQMIKDGSDDVYMAVPEIIDWTNHAGFKYTLKEEDELFDELSVEKLLEKTALPADFTITQLKNRQVCSWKTNVQEPKKKWSIYAWLNAEITVGESTFCLANGKWFEVNNNFATAVKNDFNAIPAAAIELPQYDHENEGLYNQAVEESFDGVLFDAKSIMFGGGHSKIEFCDVLLQDKTLLHVKKYGGSSVLSHLFNQGLVSAQLLVTEESFRTKVRDKIESEDKKQLVPTENVKGEDYTIVYVIIKKINGDAGKNIPFFSKVSLRACKRVLDGYGFKVRLNYVNNHREEDDEGD